MKAIIKVDVPEWQVGQDVTIYFPDTMITHGKCELLKEQEEEIQSLRRENHDILTQFHEWAKEQPHIVRCKDCKHWYFADNRIPSEQENVCGRNGIVVTPDWFCADGERRDNDD